MDDKKRLRRDDPVRTEPIRDFSGLYHWSSSDAPSSSSSRPFSTNGSAAVGREHPSDEIRLAYGVIDKHIDEGRKNAGQFSSQPYNARAVTDGFQELLERTLRYGSELLPMWLEILDSAVRMEPSRMPYGAGTAAQHAGGASQSKGSSGVSIEMVSTKPVEVSFDLRENSETLSLVTLGLRAVDPDKPALSDISFVPEQAGGSIRLKIAIPDGHPAGTYSGVIVNRHTGEARGTLSVRIAE